MATMHEEKRFGKLIATGISEFRSASGGRREFLHVICDCGGEKWVLKSKLLSWHTKSCGCLRRESFSIEHHPLARRNIAKYGVAYINTRNPWFRPALKIWSGRKKEAHRPVGFRDFQDFLSYCLSLVPDGNVCPVLGIQMEHVKEKSGFVGHAFSIDRINSALPYMRGNMQVISMRANRIKNNATIDELILLGEWAMRYSLKKAVAA